MLLNILQCTDRAPQRSTWPKIQSAAVEKPKSRLEQFIIDDRIKKKRRPRQTCSYLISFSHIFFFLKILWSVWFLQLLPLLFKPKSRHATFMVPALSSPLARPALSLGLGTARYSSHRYPSSIFPYSFPHYTSLQVNFFHIPFCCPLLLKTYTGSLLVAKYSPNFFGSP